MPSNAIRYAQDNQKHFLKELFELLSIPSISTLPEHKKDLQKTAKWLVGHLKNIGMNHARVLPTGGHPVVYADWLDKKGAPTVLIYGHYDVQPPDPLEEWKTPPFRPTLKNDNIYARGSDDNKGQFFANLKAVESFLKTEGGLPVNVKLLLEGEEELGSKNLERFIKKNKRLLSADIAFISDTGSPSAKEPTVFYGLKGLLYTEISVQTAKQDLHSGSYGGAVENPASLLAKIIAQLHDDKRRVTVPNFYKDVVPVTKQERQMLNKLNGEEEIKKLADAYALVSEKGYTPAEAKKIRPTLDVNGIWGGFTGEGPKTIIPARASAKISMRLVPEQNPEKIARSFKKQLKKLIPSAARLDFKVLSSAKPVLIKKDNPFMKTMEASIKEVFDVNPRFNRTGGTIPVVEIFSRTLGLQTILFGSGLDDDRIHSPNEKLSLEMWRKGVESSIMFLQKCSEIKR